MERIKTRLRNCISDKNLPWLMLGSIEGTQWDDAVDSDEELEIKEQKRNMSKKQHSDADAEEIIRVFADMKHRRIPMHPAPKP